MHLVTALIVIIAVWRWGDWRNWEQYHLTMLFVVAGNLLYNFMTANYFLWRLDPDFLPNHSMTELIYSFIIFPGTVILFLSNYPVGTGKQIKHHVKWILIYIGMEGLFLLTGRIIYQYGWNIWWSLAFLCVMFPIIRIHYKRPLLAYFLSGIVAAVVLWIFDVPVELPIQERNQ
jgi:phosphatidylserine synthase